MKEKNEFVLNYINGIKELFENNGYHISDDNYQKVVNRYMNSSKSFEEIKKEIDKLIEEKIASLKSKKEKERLKKVNIEDYGDTLLTIKSLDNYGYPNIIMSNLSVLNKVGIGHNAPINVKFGNKNGFYKNSARTSSTSLDKFEFIICQIGKMLGVRMAETYQVSLDNNPLGIISENVYNPNETLYMYSEITKFINKDAEEFKALKKELERISENKENVYKIPVVESPEDINIVLDSFLQVIGSLKISSDDKRNIRQDYFNMIMLDFIVNNVDRNQNNYGLIISEYGEVRFSPLFDNSTIDIPSMPKGYQQINGFLVDKTRLLDNLFKNYYDDIKGITSMCLNNRDSFSNKVFNLCSNELDSNEQEWFLSTFTNNINMVAEKELNKNGVLDYSNEEELRTENNINVKASKVENGPKLVKTKPIQNSNPSEVISNKDGKINLIFILLVISLVLITITFIILFKLG